MSEWIARLEKWYAKKRKDVLAELAPPSTDAEIGKLATRTGVALPSAYVAMLKWHNGSKPDTYSGFQFNRQLMSVADALEAMTIMDELVDAGEFEHEHWWNKRWVPFLSNGGGDYVCVDLAGSFGGKQGQILEFWHDDEDRTIAYPDFDSWLRCFVEGLEANMYRDDDGDLHVKNDEKWDALCAKICPGYPKRFDANGKPVADDEDDEDDD